MEAVHIPGNSIGEGIARLYDEMNALVGDDLNVNIEQEGGRLFFRLWKKHRWGSYTLYYFPVKFLESLNPVLRRIAITFLHKLMRANSIGTFSKTMIRTVCSRCFRNVTTVILQEGKERLKLLDSYQTGKINRLLKRVESKPITRTFPKPLKRTIPETGLNAP